MTEQRLNIGYIGDVSDHSRALSEAFRKSGETLPQFTSKLASEQNIINKFHYHQKILWRMRRWIEQTFGIWELSYLNDLMSFIDNNNLDVIVAYWGMNPLADIITLKRHRPGVKVVLGVLCHPTGISTAKVHIQNKFLDKNFKHIDGLIFSSAVMEHYFSKYLPGSKDLPSVVIPPSFSDDNRPNQYLEPIMNEPNVIFIGRMDWWEGQETDNVHENIGELLRHGIHVFHSDKSGNYTTKGYRHTFKPKEMNELKDYMTQFDASLILYNLSVCSSDDRFNLTIPDRLITSVTSGVPVAIPRQGYAAAKEYVMRYNSLVEFDSAGDLLSVLSDRARVRELKEEARLNSIKYSSNGMYDRLMALIRQIKVDQRSSLPSQ